MAPIDLHDRVGGEVVCRTDRLLVIRAGASFRLVAARAIEAGEHLIEMKGEALRHPGRYTLQVGSDVHLAPPTASDLAETVDDFYWKYLNHHCDPNSEIRERAVYAIRPINPQEEISFNYNTTEAHLAEPFSCHCGSAGCIGMIRGFNHLSRADQERLRPHLAKHLSALLEPAESFEADRD